MNLESSSDPQSPPSERPPAPDTSEDAERASDPAASAAASLSHDLVFGLLKNQRRRRVIVTLSKTNETVSLSAAILEAIAAREKVDPIELREPLYTVIDPEALASLFRNGTDQVTFTYHGYEVTVSSEGDIDLQPRNDS